MKKLRHLDLFAGIGGFSLGLERSGLTETVAFCEIEPFCQKVLKKHWPDVPIYEDIRELDATNIKADVITGGYPCQPFSHAGKRGGEEDDRYLWPEMYRVIKTIRPRRVIAENVFGHISMGLDTVLSGLEGEGYTWWSFVIPACAVGAQHRRNRIWIIANTNTERQSQQERSKQEQRGRIINSCQETIADPVSVNDDNRRYGASPVRMERSETSGLQKCKSNVADTQGRRLQKPLHQREKRSEKNGIKEGPRSPSSYWELEPSVGRVAHGIPRRVDRLKGLGNAVVPQIPELIGRAIMEFIQ